VSEQSFAILGDRPAFAFITGGGISFARNTSPDGMGNWNIERVVPPGSSDRWLNGITLLPLRNAPLIVFSQNNPDPASTNGVRTESFQFAIASDEDGPWKVVPSGLDSVKHGLVSNFEVASNRVIVAYLDEKLTSLYLATAPEALDGSAWEIAPVFTSVAPLSAISVALINGKIMLLYAEERPDGDAALYLTEPTGGVEQGWKSTRLGSVPALKTTLSEYGSQIIASYFYTYCDWEGPPPPMWEAAAASCSDDSGVFVLPTEGTERMWHQFASHSDLLFGRWSTVQGRPVKTINASPQAGPELGLAAVPEVHWRATPGPQLSITRGTPRYSSDLGGAYDSKVVNADRGREFPEKASFAATDLNGDKIPDLIVLGWVTNSAAVSVLLGDGSGFFRIHENSPILLSAVARSAVAVGIQTGDVNGDGKTDVVVALGGLPGETLLRVLLGDGTGALREPLDSSSVPVSYIAKGLQSYSPAFELKALKDGDRDEIIMRTTSGSYSYVQALRLDASEQLVSAPGFPIQLPYQPEGGIFAADFNNDGRMDVAMTSINAGGNSPPVMLLIQNPDHSFSTHSIGEKEESILNAFMADLNNDGNADFLLVRDVGGLRTFLGDGLGNFERVDSYVGNGLAAALLDVNGDEIPDVLEPGALPDGSEVSFVHFGDGLGRFGMPKEQQGYLLPVFAADLNGDGRSDLVGFDEDSRIRVWLHPSPGTSTFGLSLTGIPWHEYELFWKQNIDTQEWLSIGRTSADEYGQISTFHQANSRSGFYRAVEVTALR
jgi:hypothetical protein